MSHDAISILNCRTEDNRISLTIFFSDRDPADPYSLTMSAMRMKHARFNELTEPEPIPSGRDYASVIESDVSIIIQRTRLDSRQWLLRC